MKCRCEEVIGYQIRLIAMALTALCSLVSNHVMADDGCRGPHGWPFNDKYGVDRKDLKLPAYFDVGAGYFVIHDADRLGNDTKGFMASVKAYPAQQHYAEKLNSENESAKKVNAAIATAAVATDADGKKKTDA